MPWPDFSELSFGYGFLREFERLYTPNGYFPAAPDFITQAKEASSGYDVEAALDNAVPVFFQFKRSFVLTTRRAGEIQCGDFADPVVYRMSLYGKDNYRQHRALQELEQKGSAVFYVTSQIEGPKQLSDAYLQDNIVERAAALFSPEEIVLPDYHLRHHVSFQADADFGYVYSTEGERFERRYARWPQIMETSLMPQRRSVGQNRERLMQFETQLWDIEGPRMDRWNEARELANRFDHPAERASILALLVLDAQLTLFRGQS